jgi:hypothetical protein
LEEQKQVEELKRQILEENEREIQKRMSYKMEMRKVLEEAEKMK